MRHSHRIDANDLDGGVVEPRHLMHRGHHQQTARQTDQDVCAESRRAGAIFPLRTDDRARDNGTDDRPDQVGIEQFHLSRQTSAMVDADTMQTAVGNDR